LKIIFFFVEVLGFEFRALHTTPALKHTLMVKFLRINMIKYLLNTNESFKDCAVLYFEDTVYRPF
jgi:hypothetical protein